PFFTSTFTYKQYTHLKSQNSNGANLNHGNSSRRPPSHIPRPQKRPSKAPRLQRPTVPALAQGIRTGAQQAPAAVQAAHNHAGGNGRGDGGEGEQDVCSE